MEPELADCNPRMVRVKVDFPQPDSPTNPKRSPFLMSSETLLTASTDLPFEKTPFSEFLKNNNFDEFFKYFLIQGSLSNNDFIDGWSDFDSFVVIKNDTILNYKKLIKVQKKLKSFFLMSSLRRTY